MGVLKNPKHETFCQEYVIERNITKAALKAGFSENTVASQGSRLLKNVEVAARVKELQEITAEKAGLTAEWVIEELKKVHSRCMQAEPVMKWDYNEKCLVETGDYVFDSKGANQALQLMGKHIAMFTDKVITTDEAGLAERIKDARKRKGEAGGEQKQS